MRDAQYSFNANGQLEFTFYKLKLRKNDDRENATGKMVDIPKLELRPGNLEIKPETWKSNRKHRKSTGNLDNPTGNPEWSGRRVGETRPET